MPNVTEFKLNGYQTKVDAGLERSLLSVLREDLDLTGAKYGCGEGQCGACTVLLDGVAVRSCITPMRAVAGRQVITIEGLETNGRLHPLQQAFLATEAMQCGFCTPGMIVAGASLLKSNPNPTQTEIARSMQGNICRCGTYPRIVLAVQMAARTMKEERR